MRNQSPIRVAIIGGSTIDQAGLTLLLASFPGIEVILADTLELPTVIVWDSATDLLHPPGNLPGTYLLVLTDDSTIETFPSGVTGLFSKEESPDALATAIRQVARGQQYLSPSLALSILQHTGQQNALKTINRKSLTDREREILDLLAQGLSNKAIAAQLYLSVRTIEGHLDKLYAHLNVHSRTEAVILAMQQTRDR